MVFALTTAKELLFSKERLRAKNTYILARCHMRMMMVVVVMLIILATYGIYDYISSPAKVNWLLVGHAWQ